jgi:hypothetical protein
MVSLSVLIPAMLLFLGPLQMYYYNILEFPFIVKDVLFTLIACTAGASLAVYIAVFFIGKTRFYGATRVLIAATGLMLLIQGNFLVRNYGHFDGKEIAWGAMASYGITDAAAWLVAITLSLALARRFSHLAPRFARALLLVQAIAVMVLAFSTETPQAKLYTEDERNKFAFSEKKNVIFLVFDSYDSNVFWRAIANSPRHSKILQQPQAFEDIG